MLSVPSPLYSLNISWKLLSLKAGTFGKLIISASITCLTRIFVFYLFRLSDPEGSTFFHSMLIYFYMSSSSICATSSYSISYCPASKAYWIASAAPLRAGFSGSSSSSLPSIISLSSSSSILALNSAIDIDFTAYCCCSINETLSLTTLFFPSSESSSSS